MQNPIAIVRRKRRGRFRGDVVVMLHETGFSSDQTTPPGAPVAARLAMFIAIRQDIGVVSRLIWAIPRPSAMFQIADDGRDFAPLSRRTRR